jgi:hypothetical protein
LNFLCRRDSLFLKKCSVFEARIGRHGIDSREDNQSGGTFAPCPVGFFIFSFCIDHCKQNLLRFFGFFETFTISVTIGVTIMLLFVTVILACYYHSNCHFGSVCNFHAKDPAILADASGHAFLRHRYGRSAAAMSGNRESFGVFGTCSVSPLFPTRCLVAATKGEGGGFPPPCPCSQSISSLSISFASSSVNPLLRS